jgi:hypothetical protein
MGLSALKLLLFPGSEACGSRYHLRFVVDAPITGKALSNQGATV